MHAELLPKELNRLIKKFISKNKFVKSLAYSIVNATKGNEGLFRTYHENGKISISQYYINNKKNGLKEEWLSDGKTKERSNYKDDKLDGLREIWDENGKQTNRSIWENGVMIKEI